MSSAEQPGQEQPQGVEEAEERVVQGGFVEADFVIKVKDVGELVDTTLEEEARKAGRVEPARTYEPRLTVVGRGFLLRYIEEQLVGMRVDEHKSFEIPPEAAFGARDPSKVKIIPLKKFRDVDQPITVGSRVVIDGREGIVRSIGSGRVQVDFNHYLSGKTLVCDVWVRRIIKDDESKISALLHSRIPEVKRDNTTIELEKPTVTIKFPKEVYLASGIQMAKRITAREIMELIPGIERVVFIEEYVKEES